ncbi:MAG: hypothetical protein GXP42_16030 [Chloroflexi bacterium]|nr:hypothetical protein [Chloroflexota bacterium]
MFLLLLLVTLLTAVAVSYLVARMFDKPITDILTRIVGPDLAGAWAKYMRFAIYVVGVSGGVRIYELQRYIEPVERVIVPPTATKPPVTETYIPQLTLERWVLEVFRTVIETLQALAWLLLVFFLLTMIAYVIVRVLGHRRESRAEGGEQRAKTQEETGGG